MPAEPRSRRARPAREREAELAALRQELDEARRLLVEMETETRRLRDELARLRESAAGRLLARLQAGARRAAPLGTRRQMTLHSIAQGGAILVEEGPSALVRQVRRRTAERGRGAAYSDTAAGRRRQYAEWLRVHEPGAPALERMRDEEAAWMRRPLVSIVMPVHDPEPAWLEAAIASVVAQVYPHWQLCVADDASTRDDVRAALERHAAADPRITVTFRAQRGGIAAASNSAIALATGEFAAFLDHDDALRPHALHAMVAYLQEHPDADVVYSDEDLIQPDGTHADPMFKPDYSPDMLLAWNYITHFVMLRRDLLDSVGGLRENFDGSQDHDLLLRAVERAQHVGHVAGVLYGWRVVPGSAALSSDSKPLAREAGRRAVREAIARRGEPGRVEFGASPGMYDVRYAIDGHPSVAVVIPTRDRLNLLRACIGSIERRSTYDNRTIVIVDNGSRDPDTIAYLQASPHQVIRIDRPFNYSALVNAAAAATQADHLLLLNNDVTVLTPGWIEAMLEHSQRRDVGAVGARLVFSDGHAQHEGIALGRLHIAANMETRWPVVREVSAVTGACLMTRRAVFEEMGGFDEALPEAFNDVDYCLRLRAAGYRVIYTPLAQLSHREGGTRGRRIPEHDRRVFVARWGDERTLRDPYLNPNVLWPNPLRLRFS